MKQFSFLLLILVLFTWMPSFAQTNSWVGSVGNGTIDQGIKLAVDDAGFVYMVGYFSGTVDFDPNAGVSNQTSNGGTDIGIGKYDPAGNLQWIQSFGGVQNDFPHDVCLDPFGNVYIIGEFRSAVDFDPGPFNSTQSSNGGSDIFISKFNSTGTFLWATTIGGASDDAGYGITSDAAGNVYVTGGYQGTNIEFNPNGVSTLQSSAGGTEDIFIGRYTLAGVLSWVLTVGNGTTADRGYGIGLDPSGFAYVTGYFENTVDFDPIGAGGMVTSAGGRDAYIAKYTGSGTFQWINAIGGTMNEEGRQVATDPSSYVAVTGYMEGANVNFTGGIMRTSNGGKDIFAALYDNLGVVQWAQNFGGVDDDGGEDVSMDGCGHAYITGYFAGNVDFNPGGGVNTLTAPSPTAGTGVSAYFVSKYDRTGNYVWAGGGGTSGASNSMGIGLDGCEDIYLTGYFDVSTDLDFTPGNNSKVPLGGDDIFLSKHILPHVTVTNNGNSGPGTIRYAITCANSRVGRDTIKFCIPGTGPHVIEPLTTLPTITDDSTIMMATTQSGYSLGDIVLDGTTAGGYGLQIISADECRINGMYVRDFLAAGIFVSNSSYFSLTNNLLSSNTIYGALVSNSTYGVVQGNLLGTNAAGTAVDGNGSAGIYMFGTSWHNLIGGVNAGEGNVSGGNGSYGIYLNCDSNFVYGNYLGTDMSGTIDLANGDVGVNLFNAADTYVGGTLPGQPNVIAYNDFGIFVSASSQRDDLRQNSIYCNSTSGIATNTFGNAGLAAPVITLANTTGVFGTAGANDTIEVFVHDATGCIGAPCQGKNYVGTTIALGDGTWYLAASLVFGSEVVATTTDNNHNTSEFSVCEMVDLTLPLGEMELQARIIDERAIQLSWVVPIPSDAMSFTIERAGEYDAFTAMADIEGDETEMVYEFLDPSPIKGVNRYRIQQTMPDGSSYYSNQVRLSLDFGDQILAYTQPDAQILGMKYDLPNRKDGPITFILRDVQGRQVMQKVEQQRQGEWEINTGDLAGGVYVLQVYHLGRNLFSEKILLP